MTDTATRKPACDDLLATARYEQLRRQVLGQTLDATAVVGATGLGILRRSGLCAWLETTRDCGRNEQGQRVAPAACGTDSSHAVGDLDAQLGRVVTAMVLSQLQKEQAT